MKGKGEQDFKKRNITNKKPFKEKKNLTNKKLKFKSEDSKDHK